MDSQTENTGLVCDKCGATDVGRLAHVWDRTSILKIWRFELLWHTPDGRYCPDCERALMRGRSDV